MVGMPSGTSSSLVRAESRVDSLRGVDRPPSNTPVDLGTSATAKWVRAPQMPAKKSLVGVLLLPTPPDSRLDERVDVAVEDRVRVAGLVLGAQILHHLVRVQHVGAHLI